MTVKGIAALAAWPVRCLGLYLAWCFRIAIRGVLMVSGDDFTGES